MTGIFYVPVNTKLLKQIHFSRADCGNARENARISYFFFSCFEFFVPSENADPALVCDIIPPLCLAEIRLHLLYYFRRDVVVGRRRFRPSPVCPNDRRFWTQPNGKETLNCIFASQLAAKAGFECRLCREPDCE